MDQPTGLKSKAGIVQLQVYALIIWKLVFSYFIIVMYKVMQMYSRECLVSFVISDQAEALLCID